jgi:hypothetical protein
MPRNQFAQELTLPPQFREGPNLRSIEVHGTGAKRRGLGANNRGPLVWHAYVVPCTVTAVARTWAVCATPRPSDFGADDGDDVRTTYHYKRTRSGWLAITSNP